MAHEVKFSVNKAQVLNNDFTFEIVEINDGKQNKIGTLMISTGTLSWKPKNHEKNVLKIKWSDFSSIIEEYALSKKIVKPARKPSTKSKNPKTKKSDIYSGTF